VNGQNDRVEIFIAVLKHPRNGFRRKKKSGGGEQKIGIFHFSRNQLDKRQAGLSWPSGWPMGARAGAGRP